MSDKKKKELNGIGAEDFEIFGEHKTREQVRTEEKARRKAEREAMAAVAKARREAAKEAPQGKRKDVITVSIVLVVIVALCVGMLALQFVQAEKEKVFERNENYLTYFTDPEAEPELSEDGLTAAVTEAYYTNGGYLCIQMVLGNGTKEERLMTDIEVCITNGDDKTIARGYAEVSNSMVMVSAGGTTNYTFYIAPGHITISDDPLTTIGYTIDITSGVPVEETDE